MDSFFDLVARIGDVTLGLLVVIFLIVIVFALAVEFIDWLIVDPIKRSRSSAEKNPIVESHLTSREDCECPSHRFVGRECTCYCDHSA